MKISDIFHKYYKKPVFWVIVVSVIFLMVAIPCLLMFLAGADGKSDESNLKAQDTLNTEEEHSYISEITETATGTSAGRVPFTCEKCGDTYTESIETTNHSYTSAIVSEGNCSVKSMILYTCSTCGDTYTEEGEFDLSIHSALIDEISAYPTCTENGIKTTFCSGCSYAVTSTIPAIGHSMGEVSCTATCISDGVTEYRCSNCGITNSEVTAALGHSFTSATCTGPETCTRCGLSQGKRLGHAVHGGTCYICGNYIPPKNVVKITGTDQKIYLPSDEPGVNNGFIIVKNCTVDYSDPNGAIINFVVDATNAKLPENANRSFYVARIMNDMTGEVIYNHVLLIFNGDEQITSDSIQLYSPLPGGGDDIANGDYMISFVEYDSVY